MNEGTLETIQTLTINPQGKANLRVKNDGSKLCLTIMFTIDTNNPWLKIVFSRAGDMTANAEAAVFGDDTFASNGYTDVRLGGIGKVKEDTIRNGKGAMMTDTSNQIRVELKNSQQRSLDVQDVEWSIGNSYSITAIWDSNGVGSSGGSVSHSLSLFSF